jgi:hypothetical protein
MDINALQAEQGADINAVINSVHLSMAPSNHHLAMAAALQQWFRQCRLQQFVDLEHQCELPDLPGAIFKIKVAGIPAKPDCDRSSHGRAYRGVLFHGTTFSAIPAILSAGCLLRCSVSTRGCYAIWSSDSHERALMYAPPVRIGGSSIVCVVKLDAQGVKNSHFKSRDAQLMLRECWHEVTHLYIMNYSPNQTLYRTSVPPLAEQLPPFHWNDEFANWGPLPAPWVVVNSDNVRSVPRSGLHDLPLL